MLVKIPDPRGGRVAMTCLCLLLCLVTSFLFSGTEAGILSLNRVRLRHRLKIERPGGPQVAPPGLPPGADAGDGAPGHQPDEYLRPVAGAQICASRPGACAGYVVTAAICLPLWQFCLELLPKSLFRRFPYRSLAALSDVLRLADLILSPCWPSAASFSGSPRANPRSANFSPRARTSST